METTKEEKNDLLMQLDKIAWGAAHRCGSRNEEDINDVHNLCLMAISRAIDAFDNRLGATISGLAFRYSEQARSNWYKVHISKRFIGKQIAMDTSGGELNEDILSSEDDSLSALALSMVFDRALNDGIITERMHRLFVYRISGLSRIHIGEELGIKECRVGQIEREGIKKIREAYGDKL